MKVSHRTPGGARQWKPQHCRGACVDYLRWCMCHRMDGMDWRVVCSCALSSLGRRSLGLPILPHNKMALKYIKTMLNIRGCSNVADILLKRIWMFRENLQTFQIHPKYCTCFVSTHARFTSTHLRFGVAHLNDRANPKAKRLHASVLLCFWGKHPENPTCGVKSRGQLQPSRVCFIFERSYEPVLCLGCFRPARRHGCWWSTLYYISGISPKSTC